MQVKTYDILYILNGKEKKIECSKYSLQKYINEFVLKGGKVLQIITHNQNKVIQKPNNSIKKTYTNIIIINILLIIDNM